MDKRKESASSAVKSVTKPASATTPAAPAVKLTAVPSAKPAAPVRIAPPAASATVTIRKTTPTAAPKAPAAAPAPVPAVQQPITPPQPVVTTTIVAHCDLAAADQLFIRGEGAGLTWDQGVSMEQVAPGQWVWKTTATLTGTVVFKCLVNDNAWSVGDNLSAPAGESSTFSPQF